MRSLWLAVAMTACWLPNAAAADIIDNRNGPPHGAAAGRVLRALDDPEPIS